MRIRLPVVVLAVAAALPAITWADFKTIRVSEDPRRPLPEPLEDWRNQFEAWYPAVKKGELWGTARAL